MNELTYILGAGASFQSIPIVKNFTYRFKEFLEYHKAIYNDPRFEPLKRELFKSLYKLSDKLHRDFESHQSFDTYFKKLFHTKQSEKIIEAKKILNLYFIWEHLSEETEKPEKYDDSVFWKQSKIDKRYDALIAGLLKPQYGKAETYCKVNFITWNYDLHLFSSIKNYYAPDISFEDFFRKIIKDDGTWVIEDQITVINLNGYFNSANIKKLISFNGTSLEYIHHVLFNKMSGKYFDSSYKDEDAELIKFAWESDNKFADIAREKISKSENVVVIGYTFPLYNRFVDLKIMPIKAMYPSNIGIYIQDIDAKKRVESFIDNFKFALKANEIYPIVDCDYFYIPSNIFGA